LIFSAEKHRFSSLFYQKTGVKMVFLSVFRLQNDVFWSILGDFEFQYY